MMNRGRPGAQRTLSELLALAGAFSDPYAVLEEGDVSETLGISRERSWELLCLLASAADDPDKDLRIMPVDLDIDEHYLALATGEAPTISPLRLTTAEALAVESFFDAVAGDRDPGRLRSTVARAYYPLGFEPHSPITPVASHGIWDLIADAMEALLTRRKVVFDYQGERDPQPRPRHGEVLDIAERDGRWLLWTFDDDAQAKRLFRLDRMESMEVTDEKATQAPEPLPSQLEGRPVRLRFHDRRYLDRFLRWTRLTKRRTLPDKSVTFELIDYGGDWLPRRLIACGGAVTCEDPDIRRRVRELLDEKGADAEA